MPGGTFGISTDPSLFTRAYRIIGGSSCLGINGYQVRCISPEWLVKFHTGYELDENDFHDVKALCERLCIALPDEYSRFTRSGSTSCG